MPVLSPERHLRWLKAFEPLMVVTGIVTPLATIPSISKLYFTHSQPIADDLVDFCRSKSALADLRVAQSQARHLCRQRHRACHESANGSMASCCVPVGLIDKSGESPCTHAP